MREFEALAEGLERRGISLLVEGPDGPIVEFGAVARSVLQRLITGSSHIRLGSIPAVAPLLTRRRDAIPDLIAPPMTLFPLVPTLARHTRRQITTTHYTSGSGRPRLIFTVDSEYWDGRPPREFDLLPGVTTIGSGDNADLRLAGIAGAHAEIRHEPNDEYVLYDIMPTGGGVVPQSGDPEGKGRILRTGARIQIGPWRLAYFREEFADHGRPFGGRAGGEGAHQRRQPPRPTYS